MNRLLQGAAAVPAAALAWSPAVDMPETGDAYVLEAELPGIRRDDIEMSERELRISGEYKERECVGVVRRTTRRAGRFEY
ncbi:Hsp20/alpha crystallin family protein [Streptomyces sp. NPDC058683]|uniref:Hsp20/alpha crystallin family protein n=1 Tax=Streptomyces sp. NPDC058683 TaxID=3346597 RepID=UPI0036599D98